MSGHTEGPWRAVRHGGVVEIHADNDMVAVVKTTGLPEDADNVRVMAAAPDLLSALEAFCDKSWMIAKLQPERDAATRLIERLRTAPEGST